MEQLLQSKDLKLYNPNMTQPSYKARSVSQLPSRGSLLPHMRRQKVKDFQEVETKTQVQKPQKDQQKPRFRYGKKPESEFLKELSESALPYLTTNSQYGNTAPQQRIRSVSQSQVSRNQQQQPKQNSQQSQINKDQVNRYPSQNVKPIQEEITEEINTPKNLTQQKQKSDKQKQEDSIQNQFESPEKDYFLDKCYSLDMKFLEEVKPDDPRLQFIVDQNLINIKNIDFKKILEENADYFHHLFGTCACAQCKCGSCRCQYNGFKLNFLNGLNSQYRKEYNKILQHKPENYITSSMNQTTHNTLEPVGKQLPIFSMSTVKREDYKEKEIPERPQKPEFKPKNLPFYSQTTYGEYDPNWQFRRSKIPTVLGNQYPMDCRSLKQSTYDKDITTKDKVYNYNDHDIKRIQKNNPIPEIYNEKIASIYEKSFLGNPNNIARRWNDDKRPNKYLIENNNNLNIPAYRSQFISNSQKEFIGVQPELCPTTINNATKVWKIKQKNKQIMELQQQGVL